MPVFCRLSAALRLCPIFVGSPLRASNTTTVRVHSSEIQLVPGHPGGAGHGHPVIETGPRLRKLQSHYPLGIWSPSRQGRVGLAQLSTVQ